MKDLKNFSQIAFVCILGFLLVNCQKEDSQKEDLLDSETLAVAGNQSTHLKSASLPYSLQSLIAKINSMVESGVLSKGEGQSLIAKVKNAIKSDEKENAKSATGQIGALINEVEYFVDNGTLTAEQGQSLIRVAEFAIDYPDGSFIDSRDGSIYPVVLIGNQIWMAKNLAYLPDVDPPTIESSIDPKYYVYGYSGNDVIEAKAGTNYSTYGVLYNWPAAMASCPAGWHLPTELEWHEMVLSIDPLADLGYHYESNIAGDDLKETGTIHWASSNEGVTNSTGFTALPGGMIGNGSSELSLKGYWWTATEFNADKAWNRFMYSDWEGITRVPFDKSNGYSVRCIKD